MFECITQKKQHTSKCRIKKPSAAFMGYLILNSGYIICWTSSSRIVLAIEVRVYKKFLQVNSTYDMYRYVVNHKKTKTTASYKKFALNYFDKRNTSLINRLISVKPAHTVH